MRKKNFIFISLIFFSLFLPFFAGGITPGKIPNANELGIEESVEIDKPDKLLEIVANVVSWVYTIFFIVAVIFIIIAAFYYLIGGGQPEKIKKAHSQLIYAVIAIAIALMAVGTVTIIKKFLGPSTGGKKTSSTSSDQLPTCGLGVSPPCIAPEEPPSTSI